MTLILLLFKATALLSLALGATVIMQRASAGSRHLVWLVALGGLLALPAVATWSPLRIAVLPQQIADVAAPTPGFFASGPETPAASPRLGLTGAHADIPPSVAPARGSAMASIRALTWLQWALIIWAAMTAALLGWLAFGAWQVRRIVRRAAPLIDPDWQHPLYEIADRLGLDRAPRLLRSTDVKMPFACGLMHCTIVLPADSDAWSADRRSAVLIHELGHVRRRDLIGHTLGRLTCAIYWFHPMVWAAARRLRAESERACDDLALMFGARPSDYAEHLLDIVTCVRDHATPSIALAMAHRKEFEGRMLAILDPALRRQAPNRVQTMSIVGSLAVLTVAISAAAPVRRQATTPRAQTPTAIAAPRDAALPAPLPESAPPQTGRVAVRVHTQSGRHDSSGVPVDSSVRARMLVGLLHSDSVARIRRVAAWALKDFADMPSVSAALVESARTDPDAPVREMSVWALSDEANTVSSTLEGVARGDASADVREMAAWALGGSGDDSVASAVAAMLGTERSAPVRRTEVWALGNLGLDHAPGALLSALRDPDDGIRLRAAWAAGEIGDSTALPALRDALRQEKVSRVQQALLRALIHSGENPDHMVEWLRSPDPAIRERAARSMTGADASDPWPWPEPRPIPAVDVGGVPGYSGAAYPLKYDRP